MTRLTCDHCGEEIEGMAFTLEYPAVNPDDDDFWECADFCSCSCLASWAMSHSLDGGDA